MAFTSIVDYLKSKGQASDYASRTKLAQQQGITNYTGTAAQNTQLLGILSAPVDQPIQQPVVEKTAIQQPVSEPISEDLEPVAPGEGLLFGKSGQEEGFIEGGLGLTTPGITSIVQEKGFNVANLRFLKRQVDAKYKELGITAGAKEYEHHLRTGDIFVGKFTPLSGEELKPAPAPDFQAAAEREPAVELKNVWLGGDGIPYQTIPGATQEEINRNAANLKINPANLQPTKAGLEHIKTVEAGGTPPVAPAVPPPAPTAPAPGELPPATQEPTATPIGSSNLKAFDAQGNVVYVEPGKYYPGISPKPVADVSATMFREQAQGIQDLEGDAKEAAIMDFMKNAVAAGTSFKDISTYLDTFKEPTKSEQEIRTEIYKKYGITDLQEDAFATPTESFESVYKRLYEDANLSDIQTEIDKTQSELDSATDDYNAAIGKINENPWISEAGRVGKVRRAFEMYESKAGRFQDTITTLTNKIERGKDRAESVATKILSELEKGRTRTKEELAYYIKRAEADVSIETTKISDEQEKELLRYFPEFVEASKKYQEEIDAAESAADKKEIADRVLSATEIAKFDVPAGTTWGDVAGQKVIPKAPAPTKVTEEKPEDVMMRAMSSDNVFDAEGFMTQEDYNFYRSQWISNGLNPTTFDTKFKGTIKGSQSSGNWYEDL